MANREIIRERSCVQCGKSPISGYKYCSAECRDVAIRRRKGERPRDEYLAAVARRASTCKNCYRSYTPNRSDAVTFCSRKCVYEWLRTVGKFITAEKKVYAKWAHRAKTTTPCPICNTNVVGQSIYCSEVCRSESAQQRARERALMGDERDRSPRKCNECGVVFAPEYGDLRRVYCSALCAGRNGRRVRRQKERARLREARVEPVNATKVFDRDGWRCQLCGYKTIRSKRGTAHPKAPELDHIIPLAKGGEHSYLNVQCACRECNSAKSDSEIGQLRLFGGVA